MLEAAQELALQHDALTTAGCLRIFSDTAGGALDERVELARLLDHLRAGDTLAVWRLEVRRAASSQSRSPRASARKFSAPGASFIEQRCWVHKTANALDALPKRLQPRATTLLHEIIEARTREDARLARERLRREFDAKYPKPSRSSTRTRHS